MKIARTVGLISLLVLLPLSEGWAQDPPGQPQVPQDSLAILIRDLQRRVDSLVQVLTELRLAEADTSEAIDELAALRAAAEEAAAEAAEERPQEGEDQESRTRNLSILNPEISFTGDVVANYVAPSGGGNQLVFVPREFEFSFQAALDPYTRTKVFIAREEELAIAGLEHDEEEEEEGEGEGGHALGFAIEEGYIQWVGLPGATGIKFGKFRQELGLYNRWHTHALLEVDRPLVVLTFLGDDGLIQTGLSASSPNVSVGPTTNTLVFEVTTGTNDVLFDGGNDLSFLGRFQNFWDLGANAYFQLGASGVSGRNDDTDLKARLLGLDASFRWAPAGRALYRELFLKGEWYFAKREEPASVTGNGGYAQANLRWGQQWVFGARVDQVDGYGTDPTILQVVPSVSFWQSEWVRLRLQYNYVKPRGVSGSSTLLLQVVWAAGPHKHETY